MPTPPTPLTPAVLLAAAVKLGFRPTSRDPAGIELGTFTDGTSEHHLLMGAGSAPGSVEWTLLEATPAGFSPFLVARDAYDVLHGGTLDKDGSISFAGQIYRLQAYFDGARWTARAVAATIAA